MEFTVSRKIYIGSGQTGIRLNKMLEALASEHCHGNVSRFIIHTICQKFGINPRTGEPLKAGEKLEKCQ